MSTPPSGAEQVLADTVHAHDTPVSYASDETELVTDLPWTDEKNV